MPDVILVAFVVSVVAEGAKPVMLVGERIIGMLEAKVRRPFVSTVKDGEVLLDPYVAAVTPETAKRFALSVPEMMLVAFVASVVAEGARPVMEVVGRMMGVFDAAVMRPLVSTVMVGVVLEVP